MNIYIVTNPIPFPFSEYGGMYIVAADSTVMLEQLMQEVCEWDTRHEPEYKKNVTAACEKASIIGTTDSYHNKLIESFVT